MDKARLSTALRLKAARFLHGRINEKGHAVGIPIAELVKLPVMRENKVTQNRLEEIEQMKTAPRPWELRVIVEAMGLPEGWFGETDETAVSQWLADLERQLVPDVQERRQGPATDSETEDEEDRRRGSGEGGGA